MEVVIIFFEKKCWVLRGRDPWLIHTKNQGILGGSYKSLVNAKWILKKWFEYTSRFPNSLRRSSQYFWGNFLSILDVKINRLRHTKDWEIWTILKNGTVIAKISVNNCVNICEGSLNYYRSSHKYFLRKKIQVSGAS